jgi:hypothetical protein
MAERIPEPASTNPQTLDWQALLNKLVKTTGSFFLVQLTNLDNENEPMVKAGSRFELNGSFMEVITDEAIIGFDDIPDGRVAYIYAVPNSPNPGEASTCDFQYDVTPPVFDVAKGGLFNGVNRVIAWLRKDGTVYKDKTMAGSQWIIDARSTNPLSISAHGNLSWNLKTFTSIPADAVIGDMWIAQY